MKKMLLFMAFMACASTSGAKDIEGAFGFRLGDKISLPQDGYSLNDSKHSNSNVLNVTVNKNVASPFDIYQLIIASDTMEIIEISAVKESLTPSECLHLSIIYDRAVFLKHKNLVFWNEETNMFTSSTTYTSRDDRGIMVELSCRWRNGNPQEGATFVISYRDGYLMRKISGSHLDAEVEKLDTSLL